MPAEAHPRRGELSRFVAGELDGVGNRRVVRHLLAGCERCRGVAGELWRPSRVAELSGVVERAVRFTLSRESAIAREQREAETLLAEVDEQTPTRQLLLILNSRRCCNWFLCEALVERAFETGLSDPATAVPQAEAAVALAERLLDVRGDEPVNHDLAGRAWAVLGNARRLSSDLNGAEEALQSAEEELQRGSGDPLEETRLARYLGSLRREQRRFRESLSCYDRAIRCARAVGDQQLVGRALLDKATTHSEAGRPDLQIAGLREAVRLLDGEREPRLLMIARHNLTYALSESGRLEEALSSLQEILPLHARSAKPMDLLRLRWLEGRLAQAQGELARAEDAFKEVCDGFLDRQVPYDAAIASLDLAAVYYEQDRIGDMKLLVAESLPVFRALGIHREALAALAMFEQAVQRERVTLRFIAELAGYLQRARSDPKLAFRPPG